MITLNKNEQDSLNRMIETSTVMGQTLTQEEMDYYNANYNEQGADAAMMGDISRKLRELMTIDTENAEVLRNVYAQDFNAAEAEMERTNVEANYTGFKKLLNNRVRSRAKARKTQIANKKELLEARNEFDATYNTAHNNFCEEYRSYMQRVQLVPNSTPEDISLERVVQRLGFKDVQGDGNSDEIARKAREYDFLRTDRSKTSRLKKLEAYSDQDREYKNLASEFSFRYKDERITPDWITRDIVGYTCKMDETDKNVDICHDHAVNLRKIVVDKEASGDNMDSILAEEMTFLTEQTDDMYRWKDENQELFAKELPSGRTALKNYTKLTRAIKKLQVSKTATKVIYSAKAYKSFTKESRRDFEDTMRKIWAMHSYVSGLIALAGRFYTTIMEGNSMEGELLSWDATLKVAEKEDFKNI